MLLPVNEWIPATSRFIRSSISRIRRRSPSPHLDFDVIDEQILKFENEKLIAKQRMRLVDLEPKRLDLIPFDVENDDLEIESNCFEETGEFEQRKELLERSLKSISYLINTLDGCKSLLKEINLTFQSDEEEEIISEKLIETGLRIVNKFDSCADKIEDHLKYPLNVQLEDIYSLTRGINERIFALKCLDSSITDRQVSYNQLSQIQNESVKAMEKAQGSLSSLTSSSFNYDRKISAKNAEIEMKIKKVESFNEDFIWIDKNVSMQLEKWEIISDTYLMDKFKNIL